MKEKAQVPPTKVVTPNKPGSTITTETPVNGLTVDGDGNLTGTPTVPSWGDDEERKVTIPVKVKNGDDEVTVEVPVTIQRDTDGDGDPDVTDKDDDNDGIPDETEKTNGTNPKVADTLKPLEIEIIRKPNGNAIVTPKKPDGTTYPSGSKVEIPGENGTTIIVTIGDNGSGEVPNDNLPKTNVPGIGTVTEPNKKPSQPVDVTTPARKTPTVDVEQDSKTGDVTVTPKKPDGSTYSPGTKVEIPGKDGNPITVTIGEDGKGKVPNSELPDGKVPGTGKITEPGKPAVEVPVTTPGKVIAENGELPGPITLPELTIEVRWIDEDGNVLKPSIKTGNEKNVEHGTIPGYEFVRTIIDENEPVMTHIFRKVGSNTNTIPVAPVTPAPSPTTPVPDAVTPNADQVDTKTTNDNGAKSNDSQNVLPNTGTESNAALASLGLLGMLGGLGLALGKKKED